MSLRDLVSYRSFVHAVAGATGGFTAMTVFYPLDTVRILLQVEDGIVDRNTLSVLRDILQKEGVKGVYRGWFPVICSLWCSNFVYFYSYNFLKIAMFGEAKPTPWRDILAASIAGVINVLVTTPMWVVNTRLKLQGSRAVSSSQPQYSGIFDAFLKIYQREGLASLWNGTGPSLMLVCNPTIQFVVYEALKRHFVKIFKAKELGSVLLFLIGAIAKAVATVVTYPVQVIQSRLRANKKGSGGKNLTVRQCIADILRQSGWRGFYNGMEAKLLQTVLTAALMFLTYEHLAAAVFRAMRAAR